MKLKPRAPVPAQGAWRPWGVALLLLLAGGAALLLLTRINGRSSAGTSPPRDISAQPDAAVFAAYAGSASCRPCHQTAFDGWAGSHHALAERKVDFVRDRGAFEPARSIAHGTQTSQVRVGERGLELHTLGSKGSREIFTVDRIIGERPLRQLMISAPGGRYQVTELAVDTANGEWFDIFGNEDRKPGEWGHWTGRGMTWNSMCAECHNTRLRKNYEATRDAYTTTMAEAGVGCEACHGPMAQHVAWQKPRPQPAHGDPTLRKADKTRSLETCGTCHSRRSTLTADFVPGEPFSDHHALTIPDETEIFHADGQVHEEDYEFAPFLSSRMHAAGVRCWDCHDVHSGKTLLSGNALCMKCHAAPVAPAPRIDPSRHSFHKAGQPGDGCVDCHMPLTTYMQRHPRRDHGFTIPDPLMTREYGIPNACSRCHADKPVAWSIEWTERWYGSRLERPTRERTRVIADGRAGRRKALGPLTSMARGHVIPLWRASAASLLKRWAHEPQVTRSLLEITRDADPLVRSMAIRSLDVLGPELRDEIRERLAQMLQDSARLVRVDAAWALRGGLDTNSPAGRELLHFLAVNADQPAGQLQIGVFHLDRHATGPALEAFQRAVSWDGGSAPLREALAVALAGQGRVEDAIRELTTATRLAPRSGDYRLKLALALDEAGRNREAGDALEEAVKLDPEHPRAWYNLGLSRHQAGNAEGAIEALLRAETLNPTDPGIPYARATIHAQLGQREQARTAAERALELEPRFTAARALVDRLR